MKEFKFEISKVYTIRWKKIKSYFDLISDMNFDLISDINFDKIFNKPLAILNNESLLR